jgi:hypothetical protein
VRNYLWRFAFGGSSMMFFYEILGDEWMIPKTL